MYTCNVSTESSEMAVAASSRRLALAVGVNGQPMPGQAALKHAVNDRQDIAQALQQDCCGFELFSPPLLDEQATTSQVRDAVLDLADRLQDGDFALFFLMNSVNPRLWQNWT